MIDDDFLDGIGFEGWVVDDIGFVVVFIEGDYDVNGVGGEVMKIFIYGFVIGGMIYVVYMFVWFWGEFGVWDVNCVVFIVLWDDGCMWDLVVGVEWLGDLNFVQFVMVWVIEGGKDWIYFWFIFLGCFGGVQLMWVLVIEKVVEDQVVYFYFIGVDGEEFEWSSDLVDVEMILDGMIGEFLVMWLMYFDWWIMMYFDVGNVYICEGIMLWGLWGDFIELVLGVEYFGLYLFYLNLCYVDEDGRWIYFILLLWGLYNVFWFFVELECIGG